MSRGTAIILLVLYVLYLWFQLKTHKNLFDAESHGGGSQHHEPEEPIMGPIAAGAVLVATTVIVAVCAEYLVGSIDAIVESAHISKTFIGLILIPIVGNAAEHVTAVVVAIRNKMDLVSRTVPRMHCVILTARRQWVWLSAPAYRLPFW